MIDPIEEMRSSVAKVVRKNMGKYSVADAQLTFEIIQSIKPHFTKEFGVSDIDGNIVWFVDDDVVGARPGDSLKDAKSYLSTFDYDDVNMKLVYRLVSKNKGDC